METPKHSHGGHRNRMRQRLITSGDGAGFQKHELLEMALFATIPRGNTNDIAHRLLDRFGNISAVMDAPINELVKVDGVGETSAMMLKLIPIFARIYSEEKFAKKNGKAKFNSTDIVCEFLLAKYIDKVNECPSAVLLDASCNFISWVPIGSGDINSAHIDIKSLVHSALDYKASLVVLCHNHPSGTALPSPEDIITTREAIKALKYINVKIVDHIIIANNDCVSLAETQKYQVLFDNN